MRPSAGGSIGHLHTLRQLGLFLESVEVAISCSVTGVAVSVWHTVCSCRLALRLTCVCSCAVQFDTLYGKKAAALYTQVLSRENPCKAILDRAQGHECLGEHTGGLEERRLMYAHAYYSSRERDISGARERSYGRKKCANSICICRAGWHGGT